MWASKSRKGHKNPVWLLTMTFCVTKKMNFITIYCSGTAAAAKPKVQSTFRRDIKTTKTFKEPTLCPMSISA